MADAMTVPAAITATFSDFRLVKTRKLAQLVFEVPIEEADRALSVLGGLPRSDAERWCGIARLNAGRQDAGPSPLQRSPEAVAKTDDKPGKPKRHFSELPRSAQAAMLCENPVFQRWLLKAVGLGVPSDDCTTMDDWAAKVIRIRCGVTSRSLLDKQDGAADIWDALHARFREENGMVAEERG